MIDLSAYLDMDQLRDDFSPTLLALGTVGDDGSWPSSEGVLIGLPVDLDIKGLVYYPKDDFDAAGYEIPETYDALDAALSHRRFSSVSGVPATRTAPTGETPAERHPCPPTVTGHQRSSLIGASVGRLAHVGRPDPLAR